MLNGGKTNDDVVMIEGTNGSNFTKTRSRDSLSETKYIANANYFLINPKQRKNDGVDNSGGTCTTVAMQMLLGYHNYYSDRRIIPSTYLDPDYGNINSDPFFDRKMIGGQGCAKIGTLDSLYQKLFKLNNLASNPTFGQAIPLVVNATEKFLRQNAVEIEENVSITWGLFSASEARQEINEGNPIILCYNPILSDKVHVVVAYGYAKLDGNDGFLVHAGWGDNGVLVWVPEELVNFQIRMRVDHYHDFISTGNFVVDYARELLCTECGCKKLERLYKVEGETIVGVQYPLVGDVIIPSMLNQYYLEDTALFENKTISFIGDNTFANQTQITSIVIPNTVTSIGDNAFKGCTNLTSIIIADSVTEIGDGVFDGCVNLTSITLPTTITKISDRMFKGCVSLANFKIAQNITEIGEDAFRDCSGFTSMEIPETVTEIGDGVFDGCVNLTSIKLPTTITKISDRMFKGCVSLANFTIAQNITEIGASAFKGTNIRGIVIPNTVTNIGSGAFSYCGNLIEIEIPEGISVLPNETFYNCHNLTNVVLPNTLTEIGAKAFCCCENLTSIDLPGLLDRISSEAFSCSGLQEIEIPDSVTSMGNQVFYHCTNLTEVTLSASLDSIGDWTFRESGIQQITIPAGVVSIGDNAFASCHDLTSVELPNSLLLIEENAFCDTGIEKIEVPYGVRTIRECAFSSCYSLTKVVLPNSLTRLDKYAFFECIQLNSINIPTSLTTIKEEAFSGCENLGQVIIHSAVLTIEDGAFEGCLQSALYVEEYGERPSGWSSSWATGCKIVWSTTLSSDKSYVVSFYKHYAFSGDSSYLASPTREGFLFVGWYPSPEFIGWPTSQENIIIAPTGYSYYACWQSEEENIPQTVNIEYKDVGNIRFSGIHSIGYPTIHTNGVDTVLSTPSKLDYFFMGWFVDSEGIGQEITVIYGDNVYTETITLYAKWKKVAFKPIIRPDFVNAELLTANGSYIDSQGNVYLVEEDIEAYLNGTLMFYKKEDNLEII